jgi:hypothetical protein
MLRITNLVKSYGGNDPVLKGLDLEVPAKARGDARIIAFCDWLERQEGCRSA